MCFYFDDGSLVIDKYKRKNGIHIFPRIYLYTQSFSKEENEILIKHIRRTFDISFHLKKIPNGTGFCLNLNKRNEIMKFINMIKPLAKDIKCMHYKIDIQKRLDDFKCNHLNEDITIDALEVISSKYTQDEEILIKNMCADGYSYKSISEKLNRSYYGIIDKIRRMKI